jgi:hypothetical protein
VAAKPKRKRDDEEALYQAPPERFVAERNALAKRLGDGGDRGGAARVKKLKKPSIPAWAVNRAAGGDRPAARRLLEAGEGLAKAQRGAAGEGGGDELRRAMEAHQEAVEGLMEDVGGALAEAGHDRPGNLDRARETLRAVATDEELRAEFEAGRVVRDREPVGFGSAPAPKAAPKRRAEAKKPSRESARRLKAAERSHEAAVKAADRARARVQKAESALDAARGELEEAEADERDAADALRRADSGA